MRPLFEFNDTWIAAAAYGDSDDDLYALFEEAFGEVETAIQNELISRNRGEFVTGWDDEGVYVELTPAQALDEFGGPDHQMRPVVRPALMAAAHKGKLAAEKVLRD